MKIGIDFGTTNCTVGSLRAGGKDRFVVGPIPSIGAWSNGAIVFGDAARELLQGSRHDVHPIRDLKLLLGRETVVSIGNADLNPEDIAAELFRHLLGKVPSSGESIDSAVIATPVRVDAEHRRAMRRAAHKAGLSTVTFVYEPTAALIGAQRFAPPDRDGLTLVVDWGGGTLDIAVIQTDGQKFHELSVGGDVSELGGTKIDGAIASTVLEADADLSRTLAAIPGSQQRFADVIEMIKIQILESLEGKDGPPVKFFPEWLPRPLVIDRPTVYGVLDAFADRAATSITGKLQKSGIAARRITNVLFAGGVCQAPEVKSRVMREFPNALERTTVGELHETLHPQNLTGAGCVEITARRVLPALAAGLGVRQSDGSVCVILPAGMLLETNTFREAEFWVTDPKAAEAVIELGLVHGTAGAVSMFDASGDGFESLQQIFVPCGLPSGRDSRGALDIIEMKMGIDMELCVRISASSRLAQQTADVNQSGIPLILQFRT